MPRIKRATEHIQAQHDAIERIRTELREKDKRIQQAREFQPKFFGMVKAQIYQWINEKNNL
jgi:hypothetical protein